MNVIIWMAITDQTTMPDLDWLYDVLIITDHCKRFTRQAEKQMQADCPAIFIYFIYFYFYFMCITAMWYVMYI